MGLKWDSSLSTGIKKIDEQHKELFGYLNQLVTAMKEGKGKDEVLKTLDFFEEYVIRHFEDEEKIQKENNYPKYDVQHKQHEEFKVQIKKLREVFETTGISTVFVINTQQQISSWARNHIINLDVDLGKFLMEKSK